VNLEVINEIEDPRVRVFSALTDACLRQAREADNGLCIVESPKVIDTALDCGIRPVALLSERKHIQGDAAHMIQRCLASNPQMPVYTGSREVLASITGYTLTRGVLCAMERPRPRAVSDVCGAGCRFVVLDEVSDSTNVGNIFRTAAALGIDGIILTHASCDPLGRRVVRVSMGTVFRIPWVRLAKGEDYIQMLSERGIASVALALRGDDITLDDNRRVRQLVTDSPKLAIIMGCEGYGLASELIQRADHVVRIPMDRNVDSLNVGVCAAIAIWQLRPIR